MHVLLLIVMAVSLAALVGGVAHLYVRLRRHERATPPAARDPN